MSVSESRNKRPPGGVLIVMLRRARFPVSVLRLLRPAVQVPAAMTATFVGIAAIGLHVAGATPLAPHVFGVAMPLVAVASFVAMRWLFAAGAKVRRVRLKALAWPPAVGAFVGAVMDVWLYYQKPCRILTFADVPLGGGPVETAVVACLSAGLGLVGSAVLIPQVLLIERGSSATDHGESRARLGEMLACAGWGLALLLGLVALAMANPGESRTCVGIVTAAIVGLAGQWAVGRAATARALPVWTPYR